MAQMESPREQATVTVRVSEDLKADYQERVDSMSEDLRDHIADVARDGSDAIGLDDDRLEEAYRTLDELANPRTNKVDVDIAKSTISQQTQIPAGAVRPRIFDPLEREGLIRPRWGKIEVCDP